MGVYIPNTSEEQKEMLAACGLRELSDLYTDIPEEARLKKPLNIPEGLPELAVKRQMTAEAARNKVYPHIFRGAGAYHHYIPAIVTEITGRSSFKTAYTPYQAEISQGVLQSIFEFQTHICELTGMDVANASVYDGASAAAEACEMCRDRKRSKILVSETVDPQILSVVRTYSFGRDVEVVVVPAADVATDTASLTALLDETTSCLLIQQPNYFGVIEDAKKMAELVHGGGAKLIMSCNPVSLALLKTPAECGADIAVGEGQPLGLPLSFGGPYVGFMATGTKMMRKLPGRIVGETKDVDGKRGFVLTLQAREQHIRREKASSNICSNEALCAMTVSVYLTAMGTKGLTDVATQCVSKAHYLQEQLAAAGQKLRFNRPFFHEFVTDGYDAGQVLKALSDHDILGGLPLPDGGILWCATEMNTKEEMDELVRIVKGGAS